MTLDFSVSPLLVNFFHAALLFGFTLLVHIPVTRTKGNSGFVGRSLAMGLLIAFAFAAYRILVKQEYIGAIVEVFLFVCLWNMYLIFMINLLNSFSLRMVGEIYTSPKQRLGKKELDAIFSDEESFSARLEAMEKNAFLAWDRSTGAITLLPKGLAYGKFFDRLRRLLGIKVYG